MSTDLKNITLTFLGCGKLGSAILDGLLLSSGNPKKSNGFPDELDPLTFKTIIACVQRQESLLNLTNKYKSSSFVKVVKDENEKATRDADIVILGCKPAVYRDLLSAPGMREALAGKTVVSIMVGVPASTIKEHLYGKGKGGFTETELEKQCHVVTAIPNTAAAIGQSMTLIFEEEDHEQSQIPAETRTKVFALFSLIGQVKFIPPSQAAQFPVLATLGASTAAFFSLVVEGLANGAVELGVPREDAVEILAATMQGTAGMITDGDSGGSGGGGDGDGGDPLKAIRKRIATPGGTTEKGLLHLEEYKIVALMAEAFRLAASAASVAGKQ